MANKLNRGNKPFVPYSGTLPAKQTAIVTGGPKVEIDYPKEREVVSSQQYTFRISTSGPAEKIEVSIGGGLWQPCRKADGQWWYDWQGYSSKKYDIQARALSSDGKKYMSSFRSFIVSIK